MLNQHIIESDTLRYLRGEPLACYRRWRAAGHDADCLLVVDFRLRQYWLEGEPELPLTALYCLVGGELEVSVTDRPLVSGGLPGADQYAKWAQECGCARVREGQALPLVPQFIAKPWGREIWYTGVEARGVCRLAAGGGETSIPWLQAALPEFAAGPPGEDLVLLKILDPAAREVTGDLYFELHQKKREVYVVTHVDESAWPGGTGYIRYGFSPECLASYPDEDAFREAYLEAVLAYEALRRSLDATDQGAPGDPAANSQEQQLRAEMDAFTQLRPLEVGDVIKVPLLLPHSLQHGVRTIEFQTPVYERKILSFAQKVLTQDHWDTHEAVAQMLLTPPAEESFPVLLEESGVRAERIVDFSDFQVLRFRLESGCSYSPGLLDRYGLVMTVDGELRTGELVIGPERALLLPRNWSGQIASASPAQPLVFLLALPCG